MDPEIVYDGCASAVTRTGMNPVLDTRAKESIFGQVVGKACQKFGTDRFSQPREVNKQSSTGKYV